MGLTPEKMMMLRELQSEVNELHPILKALFPKLPGINRCEYTHGPNEMGADFVLEKHDQTTGSVRYIGVIAKLGAINQGSDLVTQVDECRVSRLIGGGTQKVHLNEIWIVCTDRISENAKKKVHETSSLFSVEFFPGERLAQLIEQHADFIWRTDPGHLGTYLRRINERMEELDRLADIVGDWRPSRSINLEISVIDTDFHKPNRRKSKQERVTLATEIHLRRLIFLEGNAGAGKSYLLRQLVKQLSGDSRDRTFVPLFVTYQELATKHAGSLEQCVHAELGDAFAELDVQKVRVVVCVDGLDEYPIQSGYQQALSSLADQIQGSSYLTLLLSSRAEIVPEAAIRARKEFRHLRVDPISIGQLVAVVKDAVQSSKKSKRIYSDIEKSDLVRQMPRNPIAALLLGKLLRQELDEVPQTMTELYRVSLELMLGRWDVRKNLVTQQEYEICRKIATRLADSSIKDQLEVRTIADVHAELQTYVSERNLVVSVDKVLERLVSRSGLFFVNQATGTLQFKHRSFAEFLCAERMLERHELEYDEKVLKPYWHNVYFFACGLNPDCEPVLRRILSVPPTEDWDKLARLMAMSDYLLAAHLTPYRVVEDALPVLLLEAAQFYDDIVHKRISSPLAMFSATDLLCILCMVVRRHYGYRFFARALDSTALSIVDSNHSSDVKAIALFQLGVIGLEAGKTDAFQFLVEQFSVDQVPFVVALAVGWETDDVASEKLTARVRAFNKRARKTLRTRHAAERVSLNEYLKRLRETPIDHTASKKFLEQMRNQPK